MAEFKNSRIVMYRFPKEDFWVLDLLDERIKMKEAIGRTSTYGAELVECAKIQLKDEWDKYMEYIKNGSKTYEFTEGDSEVAEDIENLAGGLSDAELALGAEGIEREARQVREKEGDLPEEV